MTDVIRPLPNPGFDDPAENFHRASQMSALLSGSYSAAYSWEFVTDPAALGRFGVPTAFDDAAPGIELPHVDDAPRDRVIGALRARRSATSFDRTRSLSIEALGAILTEAAGVTSTSGRGTPSPGALYPLDCYVVVTAVTGVPPGFYGFHPFAQRLVHLGIDDDPRDWLTRTLAYQALARTCAAHVFLVGAFDRVRIKYGQRGYRFALLEAGHLAQSMLLVGEAYGVAGCAVGGFFDGEVDRAFDLNGVDVSVLHSIAFGAPVEEEST